MVLASTKAPRNPAAAFKGIFDYEDRTHLAIYKENVESIYNKKDIKYGLEPERLSNFMSKSK